MSSGYYTRQQLIRRGWSTGLIAEFEPDEVVETERGRVAFLFGVNRIEQLESRREVAKRIHMAWRCRRQYAEQMERHFFRVWRGC